MIIKNGLLVDPVKESTYAADLRIADGKIAEIAETTTQNAEKLFGI